jgi:multimeric flavodoxin WrbA
MKQIVVFNGSPRKDGNTTTILDLIAKGARDHGAEVKYYTLFKMKFMACQGCFGCRMQDDCVINDEVREALQKVKTATAVVIGSPIYMMQMTGPVKNLLDRFFPLMDQQGQPRFGPKKLLTVYCQSLDDVHAYDSYYEYTAAMYPSFGFEWVDNIVCVNANDPESADRDEELRARAYEAGAALARV